MFITTVYFKPPVLARRLTTATDNFIVNIVVGKISGSHGSEYEDDCQPEDNHLHSGG
jgi:hypothetical protein